VSTRNIKVGALSKRSAMHPSLLICVLALSGCTTFKPPQISYDDDVPPLPGPPSLTEDRPRSLHIPPSWTPATANRAVRLTERTLAATAKKLVTGTVPPTDCRGSFESVARYADDAIEALIPRLPHFAHSASADGGDDFARAESVSCGVRHGMILLSLSDREAIAPV